MDRDESWQMLIKTSMWNLLFYNKFNGGVKLQSSHAAHLLCLAAQTLCKILVSMSGKSQTKFKVCMFWIKPQDETCPRKLALLWLIIMLLFIIIAGIEWNLYLMKIVLTKEIWVWKYTKAYLYNIHFQKVSWE